MHKKLGGHALRPYKRFLARRDPFSLCRSARNRTSVPLRKRGGDSGTILEHCWLVLPAADPTRNLQTQALEATRR